MVDRISCAEVVRVSMRYLSLAEREIDNVMKYHGVLTGQVGQLNMARRSLAFSEDREDMANFTTNLFGFFKYSELSTNVNTQFGTYLCAAASYVYALAERHYDEIDELPLPKMISILRQILSLIEKTKELPIDYCQMVAIVSRYDVLITTRGRAAQSVREVVFERQTKALLNAIV